MNTSVTFVSQFYKINLDLKSILNKKNFLFNNKQKFHFFIEFRMIRFSL